MRVTAKQLYDLSPICWATFRPKRLKKDQG